MGSRGGRGDCVQAVIWSIAYSDARWSRVCWWNLTHSMPSQPRQPRTRRCLVQRLDQPRLVRTGLLVREWTITTAHGPRDVIVVHAVGPAWTSIIGVVRPCGDRPTLAVGTVDVVDQVPSPRVTVDQSRVRGPRAQRPPWTSMLGPDQRRALLRGLSTATCPWSTRARGCGPTRTSEAVATSEARTARYGADNLASMTRRPRTRARSRPDRNPADEPRASHNPEVPGSNPGPATTFPPLRGHVPLMIGVAFDHLFSFVTRFWSPGPRFKSVLARSVCPVPRRDPLPS
jgi:hypothetical protein